MSVKKTIAVAMKKAWDLREASYVSLDEGYSLGWGDAVEQACLFVGDPDLERIVYTMVTSGCSEGWEWMEEQLAE